MNVAVVIPWRPGLPDRAAHHAAVRHHLRDILPHAVHIDADSGHEVFSRAGSRNRGVHLAADVGCDIVVLCDADTLVEPQPLLDAVTACQDGVMHLPYTRYRSLTKKGLAQYQAGTPLLGCDVDHDHEGATGGVIVIRVDAWWRAGGMDERFRGWGHEDAAFRVAADTLLGATVRHRGTIHHLWHTREWNLGSPEFAANAARMERYRAVEGDRDAMRALLSS